MKNIGFNDSGYAIKPPQPSFAIYGAPPFTGNPRSLESQSKASKNLDSSLTSIN